jgi:hypothetical protein
MSCTPNIGSATESVESCTAEVLSTGRLRDAWGTFWERLERRLRAEMTPVTVSGLGVTLHVAVDVH